MFECRACLQRCIRAIAGDFPTSSSLVQSHRPRAPRFLSPQTIRRNASAVPSLQRSPPAPDGLVPGKQPVAKSDDDETTTGEKGTKALTKSERRHLQLELQYLGDRMKLADHVHYTLRRAQPEKALNLCRIASREQNVVIAWNHCVDWHMQRNKIDEAIKIYNEMKKRAQFPDAYTYTLILRGLSKWHHHGDVVKQSNVVKAVSIYNSLSSPNSRVSPNIWHTNAVLRVCSMAHDMDALWGVLAKLPQSGAGSPDHATYTIILDALRHGAYGNNAPGISEDQLSLRRNEAVQSGRRLWQEVIPRWRSGEIKIDNDLVGAMGRLLLISRRMQEWDEVLDLVQQTMNIHRLVPPLGDPDRNTAHVPQDDEVSSPEAESSEEVDGHEETPANAAFKSIQPLPLDAARPTRPTTLAWVQPGNDTLSILIDACRQLRIPKIATAYWNLLTSEYDVKPDLDNFTAQLKLLALNRSSAAAATLLKNGLADAGLQPKNQTFRVAMSVCIRDKKNHTVLDHARTIIDVMEQTTPNLDIHTLTQYLNLALASDDGAKITAVLNRLDPIVHILRSRMNFGTDGRGPGGSTPANHIVDKEETVNFLQTMVGTIDTLMNRGMVPRDDYQNWHARRSQLTRFIGRAKDSIERRQAEVDTAVADRQNSKAAKEAGREARKKRYEEPGKVEPRMSNAEWALKAFKRREKIDQLREKNRLQAVGLKNWHVGKAKSQGQFADSPMDLR